MLPRLLGLSPPWRIYYQRTGASDRDRLCVPRQGRGLPLAMWDDNHSSHGGRGTERRVPERHSRITGTDTGRDGWTQKGEEES